MIEDVIADTAAYVSMDEKERPFQVDQHSPTRSQLIMDSLPAIPEGQGVSIELRPSLIQEDLDQNSAYWAFLHCIVCCMQNIG